MRYNPARHRRRSLRLKGYDYSSAGAYFITICTHHRQCLLGTILNGEMQLSKMGWIAHEEWENSATIRQEIEFDAWVIMPNHIHGIVILNDNFLEMNRKSTGAMHLPVADRLIPPLKPRSLSSFVQGFKSVTTKRINLLRNAQGTPVWQRNYYDHIIRSEASLISIRKYIQNNPVSWQKDQLHPQNPSKY